MIIIIMNSGKIVTVEGIELPNQGIIRRLVTYAWKRKLAKSIIKRLNGY